MTDINIGQITEALNNKVDLQAPWGFPKKQITFILYMHKQLTKE